MRILIISGIFPPDIGGPAGYVPRIVGWLVARGHQVHVVCWSDVESVDDSGYGFPVTRVSRCQPWLVRAVRTLRVLYRAGKNADIWFINGLAMESQFLASLLGKKAVHKIVGDVAWERAVRFGWFDRTIDDYQMASKGIKHRLLTLIRNLPLRRAKRIIVPSRYLGAMVEHWGVPESKIKVIYNSTDPNPPASDLSLPAWGGKTVVTICRLTAWKGVDRLIDVTAAMPDLRLIVVGDGPLREALEAQAHRLGLADRVIFMGQRPKADVQSVLKQSDLFVLNSTYEGLPHVVLEAMMAGVPVIATRVGGTPEAVIHEETGLLVEPGDHHALQAAVKRLNECPELGRQLAQQARTRLMAVFSQDACFQATEAVLMAEAQ